MLHHGEFIFQRSDKNIYEGLHFTLTHQWLNKFKPDSSYKNLQIIYNTNSLPSHYDLNNFENMEEGFTGELSIPLSTNYDYEYKFFDEIIYEKNVEVTKELLNLINESGIEYQFVEITGDDDFKVTIPCNCNIIEPVFLNSGKTYSFKFYNILSSMDCAFNSYNSMKEKQIIEKHFNSTTREKISDFIIGNKNSYYSAIIKRTGSNTSIEVGINDDYDFLTGDYTIEFIPISRKENAINTYKTFEINKEIDDNFVIGIKNPTFGESIQILDIIPTFETSTGKQYMQKLSYFAQEDIWIPDEIPLKATKLVSILVAFALVEEAE